MSSETQTTLAVGEGSSRWTEAGIAGLVAGVVFGLMVQFMVGAMQAIGALYGAPGIVTGWIAHLAHSIIFALAFAAIVSTEPLEAYAENWLSSAGLGLAYGVAVWFVFIGFVWPVWLNAVGFPPGKTLPVPNFALKPLVGHLVYGAILGAGIPILRNW